MKNLPILLAALLAAACGGPTDTPDAGDTTPDAGDTTPDAGSEKTVVSVAVDPAEVSVETGATTQLTVTATWSDDSTTTLTSGVAFETSADDVASVDGTGLVTGLKEGAATITARFQGKTDTTAVTVTKGSTAPVFTDDYAPGASFMPFGGSNNSVTVDTAEKKNGSASLKVVVPADGYTGGAIKAAAPADLTGFDAVTFWVKASKAATLNVAGFGNDSASTTLQVERGAIALTTEWARVVIPVPNIGVLSEESGLFHFAEGSDEGTYSIWFDDIRWETLGDAITNVRPAIATETVSKTVGATHLVNGASVTSAVSGSDVTVGVARPWFAWTSSATGVATVNASGLVSAISPGTAVITARLDTVDAAGATTVNVTAASDPATAAPTPSYSASNVISLFSDAYTPVTVDTWSAGWDQADVADVQVSGNAAKKYSSLVFAGIEFTSATIDASTYTHFHLDVWTADSTVFKVKLVDFGANGGFGGGDDTEHELTFDANSTPALTTGSWVTLDIPFSSFTNLAARAHLAQLILVGSNSTVFVDNVLLRK